MDKKRIEVTINGQTHGFMVAENEENVVFLANFVNDKVAEIAGTSSGKLLTNERKYVLAAMIIAEELFDTKAKYEELLNTADGFSYDCKRDFENKIDALDKDNKTLSDEIKSLKIELAYVQELFAKRNSEYEQLEQLIEAETAPETVV
jgi:cell division protein ZapA (FtsZ GTPase activity inhibitor)